MESTTAQGSRPNTSKKTHSFLKAIRASVLTKRQKFEILGSTAGKEVRNAIDASGEPPVSQLRGWYDNDTAEPSSSADFWNLCDRRDQYRAEYNNYWASTREKNIFKRPVDGVIMPVAPTAAVEEGAFTYYSMSARQDLYHVYTNLDIETILAL